MGSFFNLIAAGTSDKSFAESMADILIQYVLPVLAAVSVIWAIWLMFNLARAADEGSRKQAKKRVHHALASLFIIVALFSLIGGIRFMGFLAVDLGPATTTPPGNGSGSTPLPQNPQNPAFPETNYVPEYAGKTHRASSLDVPIDFTHGEMGEPMSFSYGVNGRIIATPASTGNQESFTRETGYTRKDGTKKTKISGSGNELNYLQAENLTSLYGVRVVTNDQMNSYGIDIATGEGEGVGLYTVGDFMTTIIGTETPLSQMKSEDSRTDCERQAGQIMSSYDTMKPTRAAYASASGTIKEAVNIETDSNTKRAYLVIEHDQPVVNGFGNPYGYEKTYTYYGNLYASKKVSCPTSVFHYTNFPNHPKMGWPPYGYYQPWLPISYGGFVCDGAWYVPENPLWRAYCFRWFFPWCAPQMPKALVQKGRNLWYPTTIMNAKSEVYSPGSWESKLVGKHVNKGDYLGMIGGGLLDPGAGHTDPKAQNVINPTHERRLHYQVHVTSNGSTLSLPSQISRGTAMNPRTYLYTVNSDPAKTVGESIPAPLRHVEFQFHPDPPSNFRSRDGGLFGLVGGWLKGVVNGVFQGGMSLVNTTINQIKNSAPFNGVTQMMETINGVQTMVNVNTLGADLMKNFNFNGVGNIINDAGTTIFNAATGTFTIPDCIKHIDASAFDGVTGIKNLVLPAGLKTIGESAFSGMEELKNINLSSLTSLESIGKNAFFGSGLTSITLPNTPTLTGIEDGAFALSNLKSINLGGTNIETIGKSAFAYNIDLQNITLPSASTLKTIDTNAFAGLQRFTGGFDLSNYTNLKINSSAFQDSQISWIRLPTTLQQLSGSVFTGATNLSSINLPGTGSFGATPLANNLVTIGDYALSYTGLTGHLNLSADVMPKLMVIGESAFQGSAMGSVKLPSLNASIEDVVNLSQLSVGELLPNLQSYVRQMPNITEMFGSALNSTELLALVQHPAFSIFSNVEGLNQLLNYPNIQNILQIPNIADVMQFGQLADLLKIPNMSNLLNFPSLGEFLDFPDLSSVLNFGSGLGSLINFSGLPNLMNFNGLDNLLGVMSNLPNISNLVSGGANTLLGAINSLNIPNISSLIPDLSLPNLSNIMPDLSNLTGMFSGAMSGLFDSVNSMFSSMSDMISPLTDMFSQFGGQLMGQFNDLLSPITGMFNQFGSGILDQLGGILDPLKSLGGITDIFGSAFGGIMDAFSGLGGIVDSQANN